MVAKAIKCLAFPSWTVVQNNKNNRKQLKLSVLFNVFDNIFPLFLLLLQTRSPHARPIAVTASRNRAINTGRTPTHGQEGNPFHGKNF